MKLKALYDKKRPLSGDDENYVSIVDDEGREIIGGCGCCGSPDTADASVVLDMVEAYNEKYG